MHFNSSKNTVLLWVATISLVCFSCGNNSSSNTAEVKASVSIEPDKTEKQNEKNDLILGAARYEKYSKHLVGKSIGIAGNQTSLIVNLKDETEKRTHLVDYLLAKKINIVKVFAPEHGFRGVADAGEAVKDGIDTETGLPIVSLYGKNKKPKPEQLDGIEVMIFDIQDVGARFYTYISTLHYVMEACAEQGIPLVVLDRPNPNGHYTDGPILEPEHSSFVGMHPVPVVHGMTIGEYAMMINGEGWLANGIKCDLRVIEMQNYSHDLEYSLPVKPSPNLPNDKAINLYPSLCFFEGTVVSAGRGTDKQFQIFGAPGLPWDLYPFQFTPQSNEGAKYPKFKGETCNGLDLSTTEKLNRLNLQWLIDAYRDHRSKSDFFNSFFTKLAGTIVLENQIKAGVSADEIYAGWKAGLDEFRLMREPYLLYD